ncbi:MAG: hypothetical protein KDC12_10400, partial [Flavobacteriales bacterium]|nr:hypothetical protein [Flavobacteriales bacterium]
IASVNWYGVAKASDTLYMAKYSMIHGLEGGVEAFPINEAYLNEVDEAIAERMRWFAKGFYTVDKVNGSIRIYNLQVDMRGIIDDGGNKAPTHGYFEVTSNNGVSQFSSGTIEN